MPRSLAEKIHDALAELDGALIAMAACKDDLTRRTTDLVRIKRELRELDAELTPVRPMSRHNLERAETQELETSPGTPAAKRRRP